MKNVAPNSLAAYNGLKPKLTPREAWVIDALDDIYPASVEEVAAHLGVYPNIISGRFTSLKNKEQIVIDSRTKNVRGQWVTRWRPKNVAMQQAFDWCG